MKISKIIATIGLFSAPLTSNLALGMENLYCSAQSGAFLGALSLGCGLYERHYQLFFMRAYTPPIIVSDYPIHTFGLKSSLKFSNLYIGTSILYNTDNKNTFAKLPDKYPAKYYPLTGIRTVPHLGIILSDSNFVEVGTVDYLLELRVRNSQYIQYYDVISIGIGHTFLAK
jgi:hypothetical protein